jgi:hypothetical protein
VLLTGRLLVDGGEPLRAAEVLLQAGRRAFGAGSLSSAELFLREAGRAAAGSEDLSTEIAGQLAQVLLHAGQLSEAAQIASRTVAATDGRDLATATAMRLVLARAAAYEGPELLLRALAVEAGLAEIEAAAADVVQAARWPELWFGAAQAVARGADGDAAGACAALSAALEAGDRYPVFSALTMRLVAEAAIRDGWGTPGMLLITADSTFTRLRLGRASAACRALLKTTGWADEQSFAAFGETLGPALHHAGLDPKPAVYPVEQVMTQDGTRSS